MYTDLTPALRTDQYFLGKYFYDSYKNIVVVNRQDMLILGANTFTLQDVEGNTGSGAAESFNIQYYRNKIQVYQSTNAVSAVAVQNVGGIAAHSVVLSTNIRLNQAKGVMYQFEWTTILEYHNEWRIEAGFDTLAGYVMNAGNYRCELLINGVLQHPTTGEYKHSCTFDAANVNPGNTDYTSWLLSVRKPLAIGSKVTARIYYINHPTNTGTSIHLSVTASTNTTSPKLLEYSTIPMAGLIDLTIDVRNFASITNIWGFPNNANRNMSLYMDLNFATDMPKGTNIKITFPYQLNGANDEKFYQMSTMSEPQCFIVGRHRIVTSCVPDQGGKYVTFQLGEDYIKGNHIRFQYAGYLSYKLPSTYNNVTDNLIGDIIISAEYVQAGTTVFADNTLGVPVRMRVYPEPPQTSESIMIPEPQIVFYPTNEGEKATYNFTLDLRSLVNFWEEDKIWIRFPNRFDINLGKAQLQILSD